MSYSRRHDKYANDDVLACGSMGRDDRPQLRPRTRATTTGRDGRSPNQYNDGVRQEERHGRSRRPVEPLIFHDDPPYSDPSSRHHRPPRPTSMYERRSHEDKFDPPPAYSRDRVPAARMHREPSPRRPRRAPSPEYSPVRRESRREPTTRRYDEPRQPSPRRRRPRSLVDEVPARASHRHHPGREPRYARNLDPDDANHGRSRYQPAYDEPRRSRTEAAPPRDYHRAAKDSRGSRGSPRGYAEEPPLYRGGEAEAYYQQHPRRARDPSPGRGRDARMRGSSPLRSKPTRSASVPANVRQDTPIWQTFGTAALKAGAAAALQMRKDPGPWMGEKGIKIGTAAIGAAILDSVGKAGKSSNTRGDGGSSRSGGGSGKGSSTLTSKVMRNAVDFAVQNIIMGAASKKR